MNKNQIRALEYGEKTRIGNASVTAIEVPK